MEEYSSNGNVIPISAKEALLYVRSLLSDYDDYRNHNDTKETKFDQFDQFNPYTDKIVMPLVSGKFVEIPKDIQKNAINEWIGEKKRIKNTNVINDNYDNENNYDNEENTNDMTNDCNFNMWFIILIILILIIMYYVSRYEKLL